MRVTLDVDGKPTVVDVDLDAGSARIGERTFSVKVLSESPARVELEIEGEKVTVEGWGPSTPSPTDPVAIDGELFRVRASIEAGAGSARAPAAPVAPSERPSPTADAGGTRIAPPMPGKVVELRVAEGERVRAGQVLLVLEAMKMRNEVASPVAGIVRGLQVRAGSNVRARETMLTIAPDVASP